jgi:hypothetical protein
MKKLLAVLVVFALIAGAAFAQEGSWSFGGAMVVGTFIDLQGDDPVSTGSAYWRSYDWWDGIKADLNFGYTRDNLNLGFYATTSRDGETGVGDLGITMNYSGDNFKVVSDVSLIDWMQGTKNVNQLWGVFNFADGLFTLEAHYKSNDSNYWYTWNEARDFLGHYGYADTDGHNFLLGNFDLGEFDIPLNVGFMLPNLFRIDGSMPLESTTAMSSYVGGGYDFVEDVMKRMVLGARYNAGEIDISATLSFGREKQDNSGDSDGNPGIDIGAKIDIGGGMNIGLSAVARFPDGGDMFGDGGLNFTYYGDRFSVGSTFASNFTQADNFDPTIGIYPFFTFKLIPDYLGFIIRAGISVPTGEGAKIGYVFVPELFWNFKGTGAATGYWWPMDTGLILRYRYRDENYVGSFNGFWGEGNALDITFRWTF